MDERIDKVVSEAAFGLHDDAELQREVQEELRCHILDAVDAHLTNGKEEDEAVELALKDFGPSAEIAPSLLDANQKRMKWRAFATLILRRITVPAAILAALLLSFNITSRMRGVRTIAWDLGNTVNATEADPFRNLKLTKEERLILYGDRSKSTPALQQKAIWDAHPKDKVYLANYISHLMDDNNATTNEKLTALKLASDIDPDNARYIYDHSGILLSMSAKVIAPDKEQPKLEVSDRKMLDEAMAVLLSSIEKSHSKAYTFDMVQRKLDILPPSRRLEEQIGRLSISAGAILPHLATYRELAKASVAYADILLGEGKHDAALPYLHIPNDIARKLYTNGDTLIEQLVAGAVAKLGESAANVAEKHNEQELAAELKRSSTLLCEPAEAFREAPKEYRLPKETRHRLSALQSMLLPALGEQVKESDLANGRYMEYCLIEQGVLALFVVMMLVALMGHFLLSASLRRGGESGAIPILILPRGNDLAKIMLLGVILPLAVYLLYTRFSGIAAREYSIQFSWYRALIELVGLGLAIYTLVRVLAGNQIRRRCRELDIAVEPSSPGKRAVSIITTISAAVSCLLAMAMGLGITAGLSGGGQETGILILFVGLLLTTILPVIKYLRLSKDLKYRLYNGSLHRSLVPHFAVAIIAITLLHPLLTRHEAWLLQNDPILKSGTAGFTAVEDRVVERIRQHAIKNIAKLDENQ